MANKIMEKKKGDSPGGSILAGMAKRASAARKKERQSPVENGSRNNSGPVDLDDSNSEEDSIMGMSAVEEAEGGSLVAGGEEEEEEDNNDSLISGNGSWKNDLNWQVTGDVVVDGRESAAQLSDEDYYKQDYYMLAGQVLAGASLSEANILEEMENNAKKLSPQEIAALTKPDTPGDTNGGGKHDDKEGGDYHDFHVDGENPLHLAAEEPAKKKDYAATFNSMFKVVEGMPVLPQDDEFQEEEFARREEEFTGGGDSDDDVKGVNKKNEGGCAASDQLPNENGTTELPATPGGTENPDYARSSSKDKWHPFPSSTPRSPSDKDGNNDSGDDNDGSSENDFASSLKRMGSKLHHVDEPQTPSSPKDENKGEVSDAKFRSGWTSTPKVPKDDSVKSLGDETPGVSASRTPGGSLKTPDAAKLLKENHKLRKRRKDLLALLSSTAQQFQAYEKVCAEKIHQLEEKNRLLQKAPKEQSDRDLATLSASSITDEMAKNGSNSTKMYDGETVRRLSSGVLMQEKQLKKKDEMITQLKLRCEVLKQSLSDKDGEVLQEKKMWEDEKSKLLKKMDKSESVQERQGELLSQKMKITRLKKELETALNDITNLTTALESNNEALDSAVVQLDKLKEWKARYGQAAAKLVDAPDEAITTDAEKLSSDLKEKEEETAQLQKDLESSLNEIEELRASVNAAAAAKGYNDFQNVIDDLKNEAIASKSEADRAKERIAQLEAELESVKGKTGQQSVAASETHEHLNGVSSTIADGDSNSASAASDEGYSSKWLTEPPDEGSAASGEGPNVDAKPRKHRGSGKKLLGRILGGGDEEANGDYKTMVRQRDLKIKSLEAMIHSNSMIIEKMKGDIERMDTENEEAQYASSQRIEKLMEENKSYETQVAGFEKAFMNLNERASSGSSARASSGSVTLKPLQNDEEPVVDENMFMWDEDDKSGEGSETKEDADLRANNLALQRMVTELESSGSFQEDQIEKLKIELIKLRVKSQVEKESALEQLSKENEIILAQRSALENQLLEINRSAGALRDSLPSSPPTSPNTNGQHDGGSDPVLVSQMVMLEKANKVLESTVDSLRSDKEEKLAPLLEKIALLEEEKRIMEEEMEVKLGCREMTINNLENSLQQLQQASRKRLSKKKWGQKGK